MGNALGSLRTACYHCIGLADAAPYDRIAYTFTHPDANKGNALEMLLDHFGGMESKHAVAFGDNLNDASMFQIGDVFGIAVENAKEELKAVARAVTGSHEDADSAG